MSPRDFWALCAAFQLERSGWGPYPITIQAETGYNGYSSIFFINIDGEVFGAKSYYDGPKRDEWVWEPELTETARVKMELYRKF
jgi:hypothetical protein